MAFSTMLSKNDIKYIRSLDQVKFRRKHASFGGLSSETDEQHGRKFSSTHQTSDTTANQVAATKSDAVGASATE